jgi:hypothetical protein
MSAEPPAGADPEARIDHARAALTGQVFIDRGAQREQLERAYREKYPAPPAPSEKSRVDVRAVLAMKGAQQRRDARPPAPPRARHPFDDGIDWEKLMRPKTQPRTRRRR